MNKQTVVYPYNIEHQSAIKGDKLLIHGGIADALCYITEARLKGNILYNRIYITLWKSQNNRTDQRFPGFEGGRRIRLYKVIVQENPSAWLYSLLFGFVFIKPGRA